MSDNFFYSESAKDFVRIPFSKSEIFRNNVLSLFEKRQLLRVIQFCLSGYDKLTNREITAKQINFTHVYDKLDIALSKKDWNLLIEYKDRPIIEFLQALGIKG